MKTTRRNFLKSIATLAALPKPDILSNESQPSEQEKPLRYIRWDGLGNAWYSYDNEIWVQTQTAPSFSGHPVLEVEGDMVFLTP